METNNNRFAPALNARERQELMRRFGVQNNVVVASFLNHSRSESNAVQQLTQLRANCPQFFNRRKS